MKKPSKIPQLSNETLIAFDFDGTLTPSRSSWEDVHKYFGTWETHGKQILEQFLLGKLTYEEFDKADAEVWIGKSEQEYLKAIDSIKLREGFHELMKFLKTKGCKLAIISMGLIEIVDKIGKEYEFDYWIGNEIIRNGGILTGDVKINVNWRKKGLIFKEVLQKFDISSNKSIAIGDATADIEMFEEAGFSIAINPSNDRVARAVDYVCETNDLKELIELFK